MKSVLDEQTIDIPCPHCGHKLSQPIGQLKTVSKLTCSACGGSFDLDASELRRVLKKSEAQLAKTLKAFSRLGK